MPKRTPIQTQPIPRARLILGIDPGAYGAIAVIGPSGFSTRHVVDCPVVRVKVGKTMRTRCDPTGMADEVCRYLKSDSDVHVFLEQVNAHPDQGVASMFTFGTSYGMWLGILAALRMPHTLVTPQRWKKVMMQGMTKEKDASRVRVVQLWPDMHDKLGAKNKGRADALLIAEYGRRELGW